MRRLLLATFIFAAAVMTGQPARATGVTLGLGANYWFVESGVFTATIGFDTAIASRFAVGGRAGGALVTDPTRGAIPIDLMFRIYPTGRLFIDILGGPWIFFSGEGVHAHFAVGLGVTAGGITFTAEVGYLDPRATLGGTIGIRL